MHELNVLENHFFHHHFQYTIKHSVIPHVYTACITRHYNEVF